MTFTHLAYLLNSFFPSCSTSHTFSHRIRKFNKKKYIPFIICFFSSLLCSVFLGERYDFVINADQPVGAFWIQARGLGECGIRRVQQLAILRYARGPYQPTAVAPTYDVGLPQGVVSTFTISRSHSFKIQQLNETHEHFHISLSSTDQFLKNSFLYLLLHKRILKCT